MEDYKKPLAVVLSRNYSTGLSVIRSLGAAGYTVDLVASAHKEGTSHIAASSKFVRNHVEVVSKKVKDGGDVELVAELLKYRGQNEEKPVLFPTDDYTASIMDMNRDALEDIFAMPSIVGGGQGAMTNRMDKTVQGELAKEAGLLTPQEWIFNLEEEIVLPEDMVYPCFVKPIESITGYKKEMAMCEDAEALEKHLRKLQKKFASRSILVQEFLNIDTEIDLSGVCLDQEIIVPAIIKKTNVAQYERGVTLAGRVVPFDEIAEIKDQVIRMLQLFHYVGMFDMELNIVGDKIYFNEVNLRSGGPNFSYFMSGVNLPALVASELRGIVHTPAEEKVAEYGKSFIYEKVAWEDHINGFMTKQELDECIAEADITLLCWDEDPVPGEIFTRNIKKQALRRKTRKQLKAAKKSVRRFVKKTLYPPLREVKYLALGYPQTKKKNQRDPNEARPRVLVAGRNYCSNLCMARSFGEAGYDVEVLRIFQVRPKKRNVMKTIKPDAYASCVKAYHVCVSHRRSSRIVKRLIKLADPNRKMLLVPCDDLVANIVDDNLDLLRDYYVTSSIGGKAGEISRLMSKEAQKELARNAGLPVLNSCVVRTVDGEFEIPDTVNYPCFVKPNISKNSSKSKMRRCDTPEELHDLFVEYGRKKDVEMLVEDYVEIEKEYSLLGLSTREGVVAPGYFVAEEGGHKERRGVALIGRLLPCSVDQELVDQMCKFVGSLDYEGLFDIDLIKTADGKMHFVELNLRYGASGYAVTKSGANLPGMYADYMLFHKPLDFNVQVQTDRTFISEKVMIDEYIGGFLTREEMKEKMDSVDIHFIQDDNDPKPYEHFKLYYPIAAATRKAHLAKEKRKEEEAAARAAEAEAAAQAEAEAEAEAMAAAQAAGLDEVEDTEGEDEAPRQDEE